MTCNVSSFPKVSDLQGHSISIPDRVFHKMQNKFLASSARARVLRELLVKVSFIHSATNATCNVEHVIMPSTNAHLVRSDLVFGFHSNDSTVSEFTHNSTNTVLSTEGASSTLVFGNFELGDFDELTHSSHTVSPTNSDSSQMPNLSIVERIKASSVRRHAPTSVSIRLARHMFAIDVIVTQLPTVSYDKTTNRVLLHAQEPHKTPPPRVSKPKKARFRRWCRRSTHSKLSNHRMSLRTHHQSPSCDTSFAWHLTTGSDLFQCHSLEISRTSSEPCNIFGDLTPHVNQTIYYCNHPITKDWPHHPDWCQTDFCAFYGVWAIIVCSYLATCCLVGYFAFKLVNWLHYQQWLAQQRRAGFRVHSGTSTWYFCLIVPIISLAAWCGYHAYHVYHKLMLAYDRVAKFIPILERNITHITPAIERAVDAVDDLTKWHAYFTDFSLDRFTPSDTVMFIEIKSMAHCLYHIYTGNKVETLAWASNFAVTRPKLLAALMSLPYDAVQQAFLSPTTEISVGGTTVHVDPQSWDYLSTAFDSSMSSDEMSAFNLPMRVEAGSSLSTLLAGFFSSYSIDGLTPADIKLANDQFTYLNHAKRSLDDKLGVAQMIVSVIGRTLFGIDPLDPEYHKFIGRLADVIEYTRTASLYSDEMITSPAVMREIRTLYEESSALNMSIHMNTVPRHLSTVYVTTHRKLGELAKRSVSLLKGTESRIEPTMVFFTGPPKVGKSAMITFAQKSISHLNGTPYDKSMTFVLPAGSEYWEGYARQPYVVLDDLWKSTDIKIRGLESSNIINMVNTAPYPLNMAFEDKGCVYFDSKYVFATSNIANNGLDRAVLEVGLTDPKALVRRMHLVFHRTEQVPEDVKNATFRVDACPLPGYVGRYLTAPDCVRLMRAVNSSQQDAHLKYAYNTDDLTAIYQLEVQAHEWRDYTPMSLYLKCTQLGLYSWLDSTYCTYFVAVFAAIMCFAYAAPIYEFVFPIQTHSEPQNFKGKRMYADREPRVNWKAVNYANEQRKMLHEQHLSAIQGLKLHSGEFNYMQSISTKLHRSMVYLGAKLISDKGAVVYSSTCLGTHLTTGVVMTCAHWLVHYIGHPNAELFININGDQHKVPFPDPCDCALVENVDVGFIKLPKSIPRPPALLKSFVHHDNIIDLPSGTPLTHLSVKPTGTPIVRHFTKAPYYDAVHYDHFGTVFVVEHPIGYFDKTAQGDSGALIIAEGPQGKPVVVGMHVGCKPRFNDKDVGIAIPITMEQLQDVLGDFIGADFSTHSSEADFPLTILRTVDMSKSHLGPLKSSIRRSKLFGWAGAPDFVPVHFRPFTIDGVLINPMHVALSKIVQTQFVGFTMPDRVVGYLRNTYPRRREITRLLTTDECLNGSPALHVPSVTMSTSPGYPFSLTKGKGKSPHLIREPSTDRFGYSPEFLAIVEKQHESLKSGQPIEIIWADNLKDETRTQEKVDAGKTRVISSCPLDYLVLMRMYFGAFVAYIQSTPTAKPVAVGINAHSIDWSMLRNRLSRPRGSVLSGDFTNYDSKIPAFVGEVFLEYVNWWYDDGSTNATVRRLLMQHIFNAVHICGTNIYQSTGGHPSGDPITSIYNSFINIIMTYYVLTHRMNMSESDFELTVYGDDSIITTVLPNLRCSDLAPHYLACFGMTYTHFSKTAQDRVDTLDTIRYLGRAFVELRAPLDYRTVAESVYWRRGDTGESQVLISTFETFLIELSHFTKKFFEEQVTAIMSAARDKVPHLITTMESKVKTYEEYQTLKYDPKSKGIDMYSSGKGWGKVSSSNLELHSGSFEVHSNPAPLLNVTDTRNADLTSRATNDVLPTQEGQLGDFHDAGPVTSSGADSTPIPDPQKNWNMESYDLDGVLNRTYVLANVDWPSAAAPNTILALIDFPSVLFAQPFIAAKLADFRYFKGAIRISFRVNTNKFLYGAVIIDYEPLPSLNAHPATHYQAASGSPHILVSASSGDTHVFDVPFVSNQRALDLGSYLADEMGHFTIRVLCSVKNIQGDPISAKIFVTAQFVGAEVMLPHPTTSALYKPDILYKLSGTRLIAVDEDFSVHSGKGPGMSLVEMRKKSHSGTISSEHESTDSGSSAIRAVKLSNQYLDTFTSFVSKAAIAMSVIGLSKPTTLSVGTIVKSVPNPDTSYGKGVDTALKLSMDPENGISTTPNVAGMSVDEMEFRKLLGTPQIVSDYSFLEGSSPVAIMSAGPFDLYPTFVDSVSQMFAFISGSYKLKVYIFASQFHTVKGVFWLSDSSGSSTEWDSCYYNIVDIQGDTTVEFTVPYLGKNIQTATNSGTNWSVWFKVLSWSTPVPAVSAPIHLIAYKAAADDFKLGCYLSQGFVPSHDPRADFATAFPMFHVNMDGYSQAGFVNGEEYTTLREVVHRYHPYTSVSGNSFPVWSGNTLYNTAWIGVEFWSKFYRFWRGSVRWKLLMRDSRYMETITIKNVTTGSSLYASGMYQSSPNNPVLEAEIPFYSDKLFLSTSSTSEMYVVASVASNYASGSKFLFKSMGDDASFHWLRALPYGTFSAVSTNGYQALNSWSSTGQPLNVRVIT